MIIENISSICLYEGFSCSYCLIIVTTCNVNDLCTPRYWTAQITLLWRCSGIRALFLLAKVVSFQLKHCAHVCAACSSNITTSHRPWIDPYPWGCFLLAVIDETFSDFLRHFDGYAKASFTRMGRVGSKAFDRNLPQLCSRYALDLSADWGSLPNLGSYGQPLIMCSSGS